MGAGLADGAEILLWNGTRGVIYSDGHQVRIEWPTRVAFWSRWALQECLWRGLLVLV
ncbi:hypothetical protein WMF38_57270 [Sorangium sp. So ce118]